MKKKNDPAEAGRAHSTERELEDGHAKAPAPAQPIRWRLDMTPDDPTASFRIVLHQKSEDEGA